MVTRRRIFWMIVLVIGSIGIVFMLIAVTASMIGSHRRDVTVSMLQGLARNLDQFYIMYYRFPTEIEGLAILEHPPAVFTRKVQPFAAGITKDAWGRNYAYRNPSKRGGAVEVFSVGPDGIADTKDDVWVVAGHPPPATTRTIK